MTMSNLNYAVDLIRLVSRLGMDEQAVIDVIAVSSGGSTILRTQRTDVPTALTPAAARPRPGRRQRPGRGRRTARGGRRALTSSWGFLTPH
jgi:hypothetical protein